MLMIHEPKKIQLNWIFGFKSATNFFNRDLISCLLRWRQEMNILVKEIPFRNTHLFTIKFRSQDLRCGCGYLGPIIHVTANLNLFWNTGTSPAKDDHPTCMDVGSLTWKKKPSVHIQNRVGGSPLATSRGWGTLIVLIPLNFCSESWPWKLKPDLNDFLHNILTNTWCQEL